MESSKYKDSIYIYNKIEKGCSTEQSFQNLATHQNHVGGLKNSSPRASSLVILM